MDLQKLAQLAKRNPNAAKAFLNKKDKSQETKKIDKNDRVFTEKQLQTIVAALVQQEVAKIPTAKDGKTPTREELQKIITPLIPVLRQPKDGKDGKVSQKHIDDITTRVLKEIAITPDLTSAIVKIFKQEKVKAEDLPGFKELKERVDKLADNQKWIHKPMGGGYTDSDVLRVIAANNIGGAITFQEEDGSPTGTFDTIKVTNGTLTDNGDGSASLNIPPPGGGEANTASNVGTGGVGVFKQKTSTNLEFKNINAGSGAVTVADDTGNNEVDIDLSSASKASLALADSAQQPPAEGAFVDGDKTKLDGIEANADVTDATNVSAAGAPIISSGAGVPSSTPSKVGDIYIDTTNDNAYIAVGTASSADWEISNDGTGSGGINNVVEDTTPQLGGDLDLNGNDITDAGAGATSISKTGAGALTVSAAGGGVTVSTTSGNGNVTLSPHGTGVAQVGANRILTTADEGTGNGLDADTVDGVEASAFALDSDIGSTIQAYDAGLDSIAGLTTAADRMIYTTASDTYAVTTLTAAGRAILDDVDASAQRTTLGLGDSATKNVTGADATVVSGTSGTNGNLVQWDANGDAVDASVAVANVKTKANNYLIKAISIESPTSSEDITLFFTDDAITISQMNAVLLGSSTPSVTWTIRHNSDRSATGSEVVTSGTATTSTTTGSEVTSFNDATIPAGSWVWLETSAQSGTVDELNVTLEYTVD